MQQLIRLLRKTYPNLTFKPGDAFYWSPETSEIVYTPNKGEYEGVWALLHETSHALLHHQTYTTDFELLKLEVAAWDHAKELAKNLKLQPIDENHIQDCLDTYRDWLHGRCTCPSCHNRSLQKSSTQYLCYNCGTSWTVSPSRFCRAYRTTIDS